MHGHAAHSFPGVVGKVLAGLDIVLVVVGPVKRHFLAVVGDGVAFAFGVAALGDKVAVLIVTAEEGEQVVIDGGFQRLVVLYQITRRVNGVVAYR